jgi:hypothetical protein
MAYRPLKARDMYLQILQSDEDKSTGTAGRRQTNHTRFKHGFIVYNVQNSADDGVFNITC